MPSFEQKYCMGTRDGTHQIFWDIAALTKDLQEKRLPIQQRKVSDLLEFNDFSGDPAYAMGTDIEEPCIVVELNDEIEKLIDGNHRLYKAMLLHLDTVPCYVLPFEYHSKFIIDYTFSKYKKVVKDYSKIRR